MLLAVCSLLPRQLAEVVATMRGGGKKGEAARFGGSEDDDRQQTGTVTLLARP